MPTIDTRATGYQTKRVYKKKGLTDLAKDLWFEFQRMRGTKRDLKKKAKSALGAPRG